MQSASEKVQDINPNTQAGDFSDAGLAYAFVRVGIPKMKSAIIA